MNALTIKNPYAWLIIYPGKPYAKDIENRTWNTNMRGTIAIHAGAQLDRNAVLPAGMEEVLIYSAIIGVVDIVDVVEEHRSEWFTGPFGWVLDKPRELPKPIPCKGKLGLWVVPPEIERQIKRQLK